jgi:hypothetical protein
MSLTRLLIIPLLMLLFSSVSSASNHPVNANSPLQAPVTTLHQNMMQPHCDNCPHCTQSISKTCCEHSCPKNLCTMVSAHLILSSLKVSQPVVITSAPLLIKNTNPYTNPFYPPLTPPPNA